MIGSGAGRGTEERLDVGATPVERLRALAVGDRFVPATVLGGRLAAHGERRGLAFDLRQVDLPYPTDSSIPLPADPPPGRIRAFWEDIEGIAARLEADQAASALRVVGTVRSGTVNLNLEALDDRGIPVFNTPGRNAQAVAEFVTGAIIAHVRGIVA